VSERDTYQRQTGPLNHINQTRPLRTAPSTPAAVDQLRQAAEDFLARARQSLANLEPRLELLMRACERADIPVPGVKEPVYRYPPSAKGEQIIAYLIATFAKREDLVKEVQVGLFRFYDAVQCTDSTEKALQANTLDPTMLEDLKLRLFYLSRYHEAFKGDRVLSQLFPTPPSSPSEADDKSRRLTPAERMRQKQQRERAINEAEILVANMAARVAVIKSALSMIDEHRGIRIGAMIAPQARSARLLAIAIATNLEVFDLLKDFLAAYTRLHECLQEVRHGADVEQIKAPVEGVTALVERGRQQVLLRDVFPPNDQPGTSGSTSPLPPLN
jgi:hypothetical protein